MLAGCGELPSKPQQRVPSEPHFLVKGSYSGPSRSYTAWIDGKLNRARVETDKRVFLIDLNARSYKALSPKEKVYLSYDPKRQQKLALDRSRAESSIYSSAAFETGGELILQELNMLLAHPCEQAQRRLGAHTRCQRVVSGNGLEAWEHQVTQGGSMQENFKGRAVSLSNSYDPRRGLILSENYQSSLGSGAWSFTPQDDARPSDKDFEIPEGYKEVLTDADLSARALRPIGNPKMAGGSNWKLQEFYQHGYPDGEFHKTVVKTEETWIGTNADHKTCAVSISRLRGPNLLKPGELERLNSEYRLSNRFQNPKAKSPGTAPFKVDKDTWTVVRSDSALSVKAGLGIDSESVHDLVLALASGSERF